MHQHVKTLLQQMMKVTRIRSTITVRDSHGHDHNEIDKYNNMQIRDTETEFCDIVRLLDQRIEFKLVLVSHLHTAFR